MPPEKDDGSRPPQQEGAQGASSESSSSSKPDQPGVGDAQPGEQSPPDGGGGKQAEGKKKSRGGFQRRIDELTAQNRQKDAQIERLLALAEGKSPNGAAAPGVGDDPEPDREKFEDYEQFLGAHSAWTARQEFKRLDAERTQRSERDKAQQAAADSDRAFRLKEAEARIKHDDYDEVVYESGAPVTPAMAEAIKASDVGPDIAYHLGEHPEEATRIAQLSPTAAALAVGRIEAQLSGEQSASGRSNAPPPASPPTGGAGAPPNALSDKLDTKEWMRRRREEVNKLRQGH